MDQQDNFSFHRRIKNDTSQDKDESDPRLESSFVGSGAAGFSFAPGPRQSIRTVGDPRKFDPDHSAYTTGLYSHQRQRQPGTSSDVPTARLSLERQSTFAPLDVGQRHISNDQFSFAQNLSEYMPGYNALQRRTSLPEQSPLSQLATNMLLQKPGADLSLSLTTADIFQRPQQPRVNQLQPRKQQITPPFNLSGFSYSPSASRIPPSSSSSLQDSSPTARISLRRSLPTNASFEQFLDDDPSYNDFSHGPETPIRQNMAQEPTRLFTNPPQALDLEHAPPIVHGIQLISPHQLPDRFRQIFPYQLFNAVQSKCFDAIYKTNDNVVVSAPTGSGKTALMELAICKLAEEHSSTDFKIVYQAPTKSLCSERMRDWTKKFRSLNFTVGELTGDTSQAEMAKVRKASIIVTTPEKWDSITRKWKDHGKLVEMVKLFLIDEVHILKDTRGATTEVVVSRMKSTGAQVRLVALSATVPNSIDIAVWLGRNATNVEIPALRENFGEEFRPVKLQKFVCGFEGNMNDYAFEKVLDGKLPALIQKYTHKKPIMVFCLTRKSCEKTAGMLAEWWTRQRVVERPWPAPAKRTMVSSKELQDLVTSGVAFHHAGLDAQDRQVVETSYLKGDISLICCTSTLAVGVNLPCHLVVLKGTVGFQDKGLVEYSDLEVMQMLGRAGRPQFDDSAVALIMTRSSKVERYKKMTSGQDILESTLHLNLIEHLNSEIGLGTIRDLYSAKRWLKGTFLSVRMKQNPDHYKLDGITPGQNVDEWLQQICDRDVRLLQQNRLVTEEDNFTCTEYGHAMSRYMVQFVTMNGLIGLKTGAKIEEILQLLCQASEFKDLRIKPTERPVLREINRSPFMKYPVKETVTTTAHKVSIIIQAQLGGIDIQGVKDFAIIRRQYTTDQNLIFERIQRLIRCIIDCKSTDCDAFSTCNALELSRSLSAKYWENSNLQLLQVPQIGPSAARKLLSCDITSVNQLSSVDTATIERVLGKNPPFGRKILDALRGFPLLTLKAEVFGKVQVVTAQNPKVNVKVRLGFKNANVPVWGGRKPSVTFVAETSAGTLASFWRGNIQSLENGEELRVLIELDSPGEVITCSVACDDVVGTVQSSKLQVEVPVSAFQLPKVSKMINERVLQSDAGGDEFGGDEFDYDNDLVAAVERLENPVRQYDSDDFLDMDELDDITLPQPAASRMDHSEEVYQAVRMKNGRWKCNHACSEGKLLKNGLPCSHKCCSEGLEKPRKPKRKASTNDSKVLEPVDHQKLAGSSNIVDKSSRTTNSNGVAKSSKGPKTLTQRRLEAAAAVENDDIEIVDLVEEKLLASDKHARLSKQKPQFSYTAGKDPELSFLTKDDIDEFADGSEPDLDDLPSPSAILGKRKEIDSDLLESAPAKKSDLGLNLFYSEEDNSLASLEEAMIGMSDSYALQKAPTSPPLNESFANRVFDFAAFETEKENENDIERCSSPPMWERPANKRTCTSSLLDQIGPDLATQIRKTTHPVQMFSPKRLRRDGKENSAQTEVANLEERLQTKDVEKDGSQQRALPSWFADLDPGEQDLVNEYKDYVDFV